VLLGFPILRLRGDYLAIVTLGFGSIAKIVFENWEELFGGAQGIAGIARPGLFGLELQLGAITVYLYYLALALVALTAFVSRRLQHSRVGRAWVALREDEIACAAMGVDVARTKLSAYACGAFWAGLVGVLFAARNTYLNPNSFTFTESALVLAIVVLGGMGSLVGVVLAALVLVLLPEYLRAVADYRMLVFGALMVVIMILRPQGLISVRRRRYPAPAGPGS
jgi:branched-chain amino acid transport system permease protein